MLNLGSNGFREINSSVCNGRTGSELRFESDSGMFDKFSDEFRVITKMDSIEGLQIIRQNRSNDFLKAFPNRKTQEE